MGYKIIFPLTVYVWLISSGSIAAQTIRLLRADMPEDMRIQAEGLVIDYVKNNRTIASISSALSTDFNNIYGPQWTAIATAGDLSAVFGSYVANTLLSFSYGNVSVALFKGFNCALTLDQVNETQVIGEAKTAGSRGARVVQSDMNDALKSVAINATVRAFTALTTFGQISANITGTMNSLYGPQWHSFVGVGVANSSDAHQSGTYVALKLANAAVLIYKGKSTEVELDELELVRQSKNSQVEEIYAMATHDMKSGVYDLVKHAVNTLDDFGEIETQLKQSLKDKYGGYWLIVMGVKSAYASNWDAELEFESVFEFDVGQISFSLYQNLY